MSISVPALAFSYIKAPKEPPGLTFSSDGPIAITRKHALSYELRRDLAFKPRVLRQLTLSDNDKGDNEVIAGAVHRSPGI